MLFLFKSTPENKKKESTANTFVGQRGRGGHKEPAELTVIGGNLRPLVPSAGWALKKAIFLVSPSDTKVVATHMDGHFPSAFQMFRMALEG